MGEDSSGEQAKPAMNYAKAAGGKEAPGGKAGPSKKATPRAMRPRYSTIEWAPGKSALMMNPAKAGVDALEAMKAAKKLFGNSVGLMDARNKNGCVVVGLTSEEALELALKTEIVVDGTIVPTRRTLDRASTMEVYLLNLPVCLTSEELKARIRDIFAPLGEAVVVDIATADEEGLVEMAEARVLVQTLDKTTSCEAAERILQQLKIDGHRVTGRLAGEPAKCWACSEVGHERRNCPGRGKARGKQARTDAKPRKLPAATVTILQKPREQAMQPAKTTTPPPSETPKAPTPDCEPAQPADTTTPVDAQEAVTTTASDAPSDDEASTAPAPSGDMDVENKAPTGVKRHHPDSESEATPSRALRWDETEWPELGAEPETDMQMQANPASVASSDVKSACPTRQ
jgi:hypothetical protein